MLETESLEASGRGEATMDSREALQQRIVLVRPEDCILGLFFEHTLAALSEQFGAEAERAARAALPQAGPWFGFFKYPVGDLLRLMDAGVSCAAESGRVGYSEALERIGAATGVHFVENPLGRVLRLVSNKSPRGVMASSARSAQTSTTFGQRSVELLEPSRARLLFADEWMGPAWVWGLYAESTWRISGVRMRVEVESLEPPGKDFRLKVSW